MLLFSDGFETYNIYDLRYKWARIGLTAGPSPAILPAAKIVSGLDTSCNKPWATKDGRALYLSKEPASLLHVFRPSRTVILGFAYRGKAAVAGNTTTEILITFATKQAIDKARADSLGTTNPAFAGVEVPSPAVASLLLSIVPYGINYTWTFATGVTPMVGSIVTNADLLSGDYHYLQFGMTLSGNISTLPEAWCEIRVGSSPSAWARHGNILTSLPDGAGAFYMNGVGITINRVQNYYAPVYSTIDDLYILNDEGAFNNTFLGNVKVRRVTPSADGADNDAIPTLQPGDARRFQAVDEDFAGSNALPYPTPTPEQDPLFIAWEPQLEDYLTMMERGDRQSFNLHSVEYSGSMPTIFGAILHALAKNQDMAIDGLSALQGYRRTGLLPLKVANPVDSPLSAIRSSLGTWQTHQLVFDNDEVPVPGQVPVIWNPTTLSASEWGVELVDSPIDPLMLDTNLVRFNLVNEEIIGENLGFVDLTHRFYDAAVAEALAIFEAAPVYERTFKIAESLYLDVEEVVYRTFNKSVNSTLRLDEAIPWVFMFVQSALGISDEIFLEWQDLIAEEFAVADWNDGFWEELFTDTFDTADSVAASFIERLEETFGLEEPYLWDGHELVEEELGIDVSYLWDGHELMEEYLYPDDAVVQGIGLYAEDSFGLEEEHFDGWLVEETTDPLNFAISILTQHWRYERFFGIVIGSWQVEPVEQTGDDGNHTGDNPGGW
jgi:hypothetical protein